MTLTPEKIAELRTLAEKATPRPYIIGNGTRETFCEGASIIMCIGGPNGPRVLARMNTNLPFAQDSAYLTAAANVLPEALDEIERLREATKPAPTMDEIDALIEDVASAAKNLESACEWGTDVTSCERDLEAARAVLRQKIQEMMR